MINYNSAPTIESTEQVAPTLPSADQARKLNEMGMLSDETLKKVLDKVDPQLVKSVISVESSGNPTAVSPKGAQGLMQLMPGTAKEVAGELGMQSYDVNKPEDNIALGTKYLSNQLAKYDNKELALAAFNAGPGAVDKAIQKAGTNDPSAVLQYLPKETQDYVPKVMSSYQPNYQPSPSSTIDTGSAQPQAPSSPSSSAPSQYGANSSVTTDQGLPDPFTMQQEAVKIASAAGAMKASEEAGYLNEQAKQQEQLMIEAQKREAARQLELKQQEEKVNQTLDEFKASKIDPNRFWGTKSTGEKIVAGIAIALGAVGQALSRSNNNVALDIINGSINRDIEAQKANILIKKESAESNQSVLQQMRQRFGDERVAEAAARTAMYDQAKLKLDYFATKAKGEEAKANGQLLMGQIEEQRQKAMAEVQKAIIASPAGQQQLKQKVVQGKAIVGNLPKEVQETYVKGMGFAATKEEAKELRDSIEEFKNFDALMEKMIATRKETGGEIFNTSVAREQKARAAQAILAIKNMEKLGALDRGSLEVAGKIIPEDPTELRPLSSMTKQLNAVREEARAKFAEKLKTRLVDMSPEAEKTISNLMSVKTFKEE